MMDYKGKRVLVTGATGFIGGRLAERLAFEHGAEVVILLRDWRRAVWASRLPAHFIEGDVTDPQAVARAVQGCQLVFHCAAGGGTREGYRRVNVDGTQNVLEAAWAAGVPRVVHVSTIGVHGPNPPENADESAPLVSVGDDYGDSKIAAEQLIADFRRQHSLGIVIVRPTFVWGPRSEGFTLDPVRQIRAGTWQLVDHGEGTCHAVYIDNLVDALLLAGSVPGIEGETFLITDGRPCTWADLFLAYAGMVGVKSLPSVSSKQVSSHPVRRLDQALSDFHDLLGRRMPGLQPFRLCFRGGRFVIRKARRLFGPIPVFRDWDLIKYGRRGSLNTSKAKTRLGYTPRITREEAMRQVELWLRDQRLVL